MNLQKLKVVTILVCVVHIAIFLFDGQSTRFGDLVLINLIAGLVAYSYLDRCLTQRWGLKRFLSFFLPFCGTPGLVAVCLWLDMNPPKQKVA